MSERELKELLRQAYAMLSEIRYADLYNADILDEFTEWERTVREILGESK